MSKIETHNENNVQFQNIDYKFDQVGNVLSYTNKCLTGVNGNYSTTKRLFWSGFGDGGVIAEQYAKKMGS